MRDLYPHTVGLFLESPNNIHPLRESFEMMETNFHPVTIDYLFGRPRNWKRTATRRHDHHVTMGTAFQITDVTVMRQNLWPQLKVGGRFKYSSPWCAHDD